MATPETARAEQLRHLMIDAQVHLNAAAQAIGYDSITAAISYAEDETNPLWSAEGKAFRKWRSELWIAFFRLTAGPDLPAWPALREHLPKPPTQALKVSYL